MSRMLRRVTTRAAAAGTVVLASLFSTGVVGAQVPPADVFKIEHFANVNTPGACDDTTVRITNPGTGLRAWGTHVEVPFGSAEGAFIEEGVFITETAFEDATLSSAELSVLADKCGDINDNGSGHGVCTCGMTEEVAAPQGTLCALIYVFSADQQLAECCGCPVTPNGLLTLSVTKDLTSNPLTGVKPRSGVIKILSSTGAPTCDPTAPSPSAGPTTTVTSTTVTSTTATASTSTTAMASTSTTTTVIPVTSAPSPLTSALLSQCRPRFLSQCTTMPDCESVKARKAPTA